MKATDTLKVCSMGLADLDAATRWAEKEGWNPICHAVSAYYTADPQGFFLLKNQHITIATMSKVKYSQGLAFIGYYIVEPAHRGQGYGKYLWDKVTENIDNEMYVALDGVVAQLNNYQASGFELYTTTSRYRQNTGDHKKNHINLSSSITLNTDVDMAELIAYDQTVFSQHRADFLKHWLQLPSAKLVVAYDTQKQHICGYGQLVKAVEGYRISPLFADNVDIAIAIYDKLCQAAPGNIDIYIDIPNNLDSAKALINYFGLTKVFETARMYYHGKQPERLWHKEFGRTTLELG